MKWQLGRGGIKKYVEQTKHSPEYLMRLFALEFYRQVTISTPVDTGRARWGWNCAVNSPDLTIPPDGKYTLDNNRAIQAFKNFNASTDTLYITNAVPYIGRLNNGYSKQAPARFVELCFENVVYKLDSLAKK